MQGDPRMAAVHKVQSRASPDFSGLRAWEQDFMEITDEISLLENSINVAGELGTFGRF